MRSDKTYRALGLATALTLALPVLAAGQQLPFRSQQSANLPTAQTLAKGQLLFEISHRFFPPVTEGAEALWGFDGPVANRLGLAYALSDRMLIGALRSNLDDNLELNVKVRVFEGGSEQVPVMIGVMGGVAWNTADPGGSGAEDNESQAYGQLMLNALFGERFAVGVVPTILRNPRIQDADAENAFALGIHGQVYVSRRVSLLGEWIFSEERTDLTYDSGSFGIELQTRGHFFKIVLTNQYRMNPTQVLGGTPYRFEADELRVGFNITR